LAAEPCDIPASLLSGGYDLKHVAAAVKDKRLTVAVVGTGSSLLAGPDGPRSAYPARLEEALKHKLPGVDVKVVSLARSRMTAEDLARGMDKMLSDEKPELVIWQTGTLDAIRRVDPDDFRAALDEGVETLHKGGVDVILMNMQYSPRTDIMVPLGPYADNMRFRCSTASPSCAIGRIPVRSTFMPQVRTMCSPSACTIASPGELPL
jgi:lysophospholipase L1-like esterase